MSDIKTKIRGLLNIAQDDAASEHEIETALLLAQRMMAKHHLSEDDLAEDPLKQEEDIANSECGISRSWVAKCVYTWEYSLASAVCQAVGGVKVCAEPRRVKTTDSGLYCRDRNGQPLEAASLMFYGIAEDAAIAQRLFDELRIAVTALARLRYGGVTRGNGAVYAEGFADGLKTKLAAETRREHEQAKLAASTDNRGLILVERRNALIRRKADRASDWLQNEKGIRLKKQSRYGASGDSGARQAGHRDGSKYDLNAARSLKLN